MKKWMKAVAIVFGFVLVICSIIIAVAACSEIVFDVIARRRHEIHWDIWGIMLGVGTFGVLLIQTGQMAEALETISERFPNIATLVSSMWPGGRRRTDPPAIPAPAPPSLTPPPPGMAPPLGTTPAPAPLRDAPPVPIPDEREVFPDGRGPNDQVGGIL